MAVRTAPKRMPTQELEKEIIKLANQGSCSKNSIESPMMSMPNRNSASPPKRVMSLNRYILIVIISPLRGLQPWAAESIIGEVLCKCDLISAKDCACRNKPRRHLCILPGRALFHSKPPRDYQYYPKTTVSDPILAFLSKKAFVFLYSFLVSPDCQVRGFYAIITIAKFSHEGESVPWAHKAQKIYHIGGIHYAYAHGFPLVRRGQ